MTAITVVLLGWGLMCALGLIAAAALCRSGHLEDEARGYVDPDVLRVPAQERRLAGEVTHK